MNHLWPSDILLRFRSHGNDVSSLLIFVVLLSELKNNFTVGPFLTNEHGEVRLASKYLRSFIETTKLEYPMDYDGTLADCSGFEVVVEDSEELRQRLDRLTEFYPMEARKLEEQISISSNGNFIGFRNTWRFPFESEVIDIELVSMGR